MNGSSDRGDGGTPWAGAAAGVIAVTLFAIGGAVVGDRPAFDSAATEQAAFFDESRTRIQVGCALMVVAGPFFAWFLTTVATLARARGPAPARAGAVAAACGSVFLALLLTDLTTLAVGALRPATMLADPELAAALVDLELVLMASAAPLVVAMLASFALLALRHGALWPRWVGALAASAAAVYALRFGSLFTTDGPFAADGVLGFWAPVVALIATVATASVRLALDLRRGAV